jgi:D-serine deaminase-like pyridoxal phosphate-dependent protein
MTDQRLALDLTRFRNWPDPRLSVDEAAGLRLHVGELMLPTLALVDSALRHNAQTMSDWVSAQDAVLAPHGKTTMSPELIRLQLDHGAWAITAATVSQARLFAGWGVQRILLANEVADPAGLRWLASTLAEGGPEVIVLVDSNASVDLLSGAMAPAAEASGRGLGVLLEVGIDAGRAGVRDDATGLAVARRVAGSPGLVLRGVEAFEGVAGRDRSDPDLAAVRALLARVLALAERLEAERLVPTDEIIVTAGGSVYPDVVAESLSAWAGAAPIRRVIRSGGYLTHDHGMLAAVSPMRAPGGDYTLRPALRLFAVVLSRPEPRLAIVGFGKRDAPYDAGLPVALSRHPRIGDRFGARMPATGISVARLNDQHAFCRVEAGNEPAVGDLLEFGISHPCTAFDKWPLVPVLDDDDRLTGVVTTVF